jgi:hypothetical protein
MQACTERGCFALYRLSAIALQRSRRHRLCFLVTRCVADVASLMMYEVFLVRRSCFRTERRHSSGSGQMGAMRKTFITASPTLLGGYLFVSTRYKCDVRHFAFFIHQEDRSIAFG